MIEESFDISMTVDDRPVRARVRPRYLLSDFLRETAGVGGVHVACGQGVCGACTVAVDGTPVRACLMLAVQADGTRVQSIASLSILEANIPGNVSGDVAGDTAETPGGLTRLQKAFREHHALQCGYCTPGLLVSTALFLAQHKAASPVPGPNDASRAAIIDHLNGHLCRCTGYANIISAIESVLT